MKSLQRKILRRISLKLFCFLKSLNWDLFKYYPPVIPDDYTLHKWQTSPWKPYQKWINDNDITTESQWIKAHQLAKQGFQGVKISIVTPVYNTPPDVLYECVFSIRTQTSPFWELILVDDGSTENATLNMLKSNICKDPRIRILSNPEENDSGISAATNIGINAAEGDYIVFLDHDDRLSPDAIQMLIAYFSTFPDADILYSDRDMISPEGERFMHLMKPDWSPENLYSGNYIFHLMCYRKELIDQAGQLRSDYDGSQDYDLILRCMEFSPVVKHIPHILYHWRQHEDSVAMLDHAKNYAFDAGKAALRDALKRRNIDATVSENSSLWRGNYEIQPALPEANEIAEIILPENVDPETYHQSILTNPVLINPPPYIFIRNETCLAQNELSTRILASWLQLHDVGFVSGCTLSKDNTFLYAGMIFGKEGRLVRPYSGFDSSEHGYMAVTKSARNISLPNPYSVMIRGDLLLHLLAQPANFSSHYALLHYVMLAAQENWRVVYVPRAVHSDNADTYNRLDDHPIDRSEFYRIWRKSIDAGDPFYNTHLNNRSTTYDLR